MQIRATITLICTHGLCVRRVTSHIPASRLRNWCSSHACICWTCVHVSQTKGIMWGRRLGVKRKVIYEETNFNYIPLNISFLCSHGVIVVLYCCSSLSGMLFQLIWNTVPCRLESCSILCGTKPSVKESCAIAEKYWCKSNDGVVQKNWKRLPYSKLCLRVRKVPARWKHVYEGVACTSLHVLPPQTTDIFFFLSMVILPFHSFTVVPQPYQMTNCYAVVGAISLTCTSVTH